MAGRRWVPRILRRRHHHRRRAPLTAVEPREAVSAEEAKHIADGTHPDMQPRSPAPEE